MRFFSSLFSNKFYAVRPFIVWSISSIATLTRPMVLGVHIMEYIQIDIHFYIQRFKYVIFYIVIQYCLYCSIKKLAVGVAF